ncbi:hypothetical protein [Agromyces ramosus]|uniref:hypothetical protein n=1 Tax=Agromyces ramosus TaxID=33879 RepID=UPI001A92BE3C|nr:hypothetical protein [Agromyces ramosus]
MSMLKTSSRDGKHTHMSHADRDRLDGRRTLVTGGTKGTGVAVVKRLRELGADVFVSARSMPEGYEYPDRFIAADTSTKEGTELVAAELVKAFSAPCGWIARSSPA